MLELREYQKRSLEALETYLASAVLEGANFTFYKQTNRAYREIDGLPGLPYVCLRVPTGGGKTFMACHALGIAARTYLHADHLVCLWLVPTNAILDQTLKSLRDRQHPYRQALDARFPGQVRVMDLAEALYLQRGTLDGETVVIVSTLAALRVEDTEGRKVYEPAGALSHHFTGLSADLEVLLERGEDGIVPHSLANVLRLRRPLVIMDEAHNARTELSFETLARFRPSCIIEFTATPETEHNPRAKKFASNVLHHVSAAELKAEEMVKLPIKLQTHDDWKEVVGSALLAQRTLEAAAKHEEQLTGEHIRPIVLLQAQPRSQQRQTLTVDVVRQCLIEDYHVPENQVAVATGQTREIEDVNLFDRACPIRFIITIQALKEGWDCSFAYVLCSVADVSSSRAVEQILGRILRLPNAHRKKRDELNCAYAFAASRQFIEAAGALKDALVENGFQRMEAEDFVTGQSADLQGGLFFKTSERVAERPALSSLPAYLSGRIGYDENSSCLTLTGPMSEEEMLVLQNCFSSPEGKEAVTRIFRKAHGFSVEPPQVVPSGVAFKVPCLAIRVGDQLEIFEESHFGDFEWNVAECDPHLSEAEFPSEFTSGKLGEIDVTEKGKVEFQFVRDLHEQLNLLSPEPGWTVASLANWIDRNIPHRDIPLTHSSLFIHKALSGLIDSRGITIEALARQKFRLRDAIEMKIDHHRQFQTSRNFQNLLFGPESHRIIVSPELCFSFEEDQYSPNWYYDGNNIFNKHFFKRIGELKAQGEEFECAAFLDQLPEVKHWVRNLPRRPMFSFWLQTSTDRFYPDFIAELNDGRFLIVEYKGKYLEGPDTDEKQAVGELWADRSNGKCLFVMPMGKDWSSITEVIRK